jgi:hypothetical protein
MLCFLPLLVSLAPAGPRPFAEERLLLDGRLETLRRILPDGAHPAVDEATVTELARGTALADFGVKARPPLETTSLGEVALDVTARGSLAEAEKFFRQVALSPRLVDVESLDLAATPAGQVRITAALKLPYRPLRAPLPAAPEGPRPANATRPQLEQLGRDMALALVKSETIARLRRARRNPRLFLSELSAIARDRAVVFTHARLRDRFSVGGFTVGEASMRALESRFERGFFRVSDVLVVRQGACYRFEAHGTSPVVGAEAELPLPSEEPFRADEAVCRVDRDASRLGVVRAPAGKTPGNGPLTLRLRDVDVADVFQVLHLLTGLGFTVDGDVTGRLDVELSRVDLEAALAALQQRTGTVVNPLGPLRRVSRARVPAEPVSVAAPSGTPAVTLAIKRATVRDVLAVLAEADPSLGGAGAGAAGRLSVFASDVPAAVLAEAVRVAAGLPPREGTAPTAEAGSGTAGPGEARAAGADESSPLRVGPQEVSVHEFALAGLAQAAEAWMALAYSPTGTLYVYRAGDRLADGAVRAVESTDAVVDSEDGPLRFLLAEPRRQ